MRPHYLIAFFAIFILILNQSAAQQIFLSQQHNSRNMTSNHILGKVADRYLLFSDLESAGQLMHFNRSMELVATIEIKYPEERSRVRDIIRHDSTFSLIFEKRSSNIVTLKGYEYYATGSLKQEYEIVSTGSEFGATRFQSYRSAEDQYFFSMYRGERQEVNAVLFNLQERSVKWQGKLDPDLISSSKNLHEVIVSGDGYVFFVTEEERRWRRQSKKIEIIGFDSEMQKFNKVEVDLDDHILFDVKFQYDQQNRRLVAGGLYSEKRPNVANGFFYLSVHPETLSYTLSFKPLNQQFLSILYGQEPEQEVNLSDVVVNEIVLRFDGGILLIAEQQKLFTRRSSSVAGRYYMGRDLHHTDYYYNDIILVSIHPSGEIYWSNILRKRQYSQDDDAMYSSYFLLKTPEALRFIYNDEVRQNGLISEYIVEANGESRRRALPSINQQNVLIKLPSGLQTDVNEFIAISEFRNQLRLVRFEY